MAVAVPEAAVGAPLPAPSKVRWHWPLIVLLGGLWAWAVAINAFFWETDPNYSYGWIVPLLLVFYLWKRLGTRPEGFWSVSPSTTERRLNPWLLALPALALFPIEVYRVEYHQSGIVLWVINLATVAVTLASAWWLGGRRLLWQVLFPVLFFLTAVPWPAKIATPIQQGLMTNVAQVVSEILLWLGHPVQLDGAVMHLSKGTVGVVEACSGIRSLQSGLMVSLAVGELLMLTRARRAGLVGLGILLALFSNLVRTFTLCWIMDTQGDTAMHRWHDPVGEIAMYSFYALIYVGGKLLEAKEPAPWPQGSGGPWRNHFVRLNWSAVPDLRPLLGLGLVMFAVVHGWYFVLKLQVKPQTTPYFVAKYGADSGNEKEKFDEQVWGRLGANEGDQMRHPTPLSPAGYVDAYHLFWRPSPMSKTALHHRPDVCMPGSGWKQVGEVETLQIPLNGRPLRWLLFRFERGDLKAMQLWGVWRNGEPVEMDYSDKLTALPEKYRPIPSPRHLMGVELVSLFMPYRGEAPPTSVFQTVLPGMFDYHSPPAGAQ
ncbi:MAG TPA: exosortase/archaeosortase family protein [Candidatus Limnocylindria bacterium]|nr:exosortase/archaeosortase family protein [Candidatus Limnocylindria bacterium]